MGREQAGRGTEDVNLGTGAVTGTPWERGSWRVESTGDGLAQGERDRTKSVRTYTGRKQENNGGGEGENKEGAAPLLCRSRP